MGRGCGAVEVGEEETNKKKGYPYREYRKKSQSTGAWKINRSRTGYVLFFYLYRLSVEEAHREELLGRFGTLRLRAGRESAERLSRDCR